MLSKSVWLRINAEILHKQNKILKTAHNRNVFDELWRKNIVTSTFSMFSLPAPGTELGIWLDFPYRLLRRDLV